MSDNFDNSTARRIIDMVNDGQISAYEVMLVLLNHMSEEQVRDTAKKSLLFNEDYVAIQKEMGYEVRGYDDMMASVGKCSHQLEE